MVCALLILVLLFCFCICTSLLKSFVSHPVTLSLTFIMHTNVTTVFNSNSKCIFLIMREIYSSKYSIQWNLISLNIAEKFIGATIVLLSLSVGTSIFTVNCHFKGHGSHRPPVWIRRLVLNYLARLVFMEVKPVRSLRNCFRKQRTTQVRK